MGQSGGWGSLLELALGLRARGAAAGLDQESLGCCSALGFVMFILALFWRGVPMAKPRFQAAFSSCRSQGQTEDGALT